MNQWGVQTTSVGCTHELPDMFDAAAVSSQKQMVQSWTSHWILSDTTSKARQSTIWPAKCMNWFGKALNMAKNLICTDIISRGTQKGKREMSSILKDLTKILFKTRRTTVNDKETLKRKAFIKTIDSHKRAKCLLGMYPFILLLSAANMHRNVTTHKEIRATRRESGSKSIISPQSSLWFGGVCASHLALMCTTAYLRLDALC